MITALDKSKQDDTNGVFSSNSLGSSLSVLVGEDNEPVHVGVAKELSHDSALKPGGYNNH